MSSIEDRVLSNLSSQSVKRIHFAERWDGGISEKKKQNCRSLASVNRLLYEIDTTGSAHSKRWSGRRRTARTDENMRLVEGVTLSQENMPRAHRTVWQIAGETGT